MPDLPLDLIFTSRRGGPILQKSNYQASGMLR